jgi:PAS domain-containing protein
MDAIIDRLMRSPVGAESVPEMRAYSERVQQELRSLRHNREQLLSIIDLIPVAFFVKDHNSRFFLMNRACDAMGAVFRAAAGHGRQPILSTRSDGPVSG